MRRSLTARPEIVVHERSNPNGSEHFQSHRTEPGKIRADTAAARGMVQASVASGRHDFARAQAAQAVGAIVEQPEQSSRRQSLQEADSTRPGLLRLSASRSSGVAPSWLWKRLTTISIAA